MPRTARIGSLSLALIAGPCLAALLVARPAPAGPPGPWVFIPAPSASAGKAAPSGKSKAEPLPGVPTPPVPSGSVMDGMERSRLATVVIERAKKPIALGIFLSEKNVVLTARSPIVLGGGTADLEVRFPDAGKDGATTKVKLHHEDESWDLALLVPYSAKGTEGAKASDADPMSPTSTFSTFVLLKNGKVQPQATSVLGRRDYLSPDGELLKDALSIDTKNVAIGTPIVDSNGGVVGLVGRACAPGTGKAGTKSSCTPVLFGASIAQVRKFLKTSPPIKAPTPWLGIVGLTDKNGVRVIQVQDGSPAQTAGLKGGDAASADYVLAVDSNMVKTSEELSEQVKKHAPGDDMKLLVVRAGVVREVKVTLKTLDEGAETSSKAPSSPVPTILVPLPPLPPVFGPPAKSKLVEGNAI